MPLFRGAYIKNIHRVFIVSLSLYLFFLFFCFSVFRPSLAYLHYLFMLRGCFPEFILFALLSYYCVDLVFKRTL